MFGGLGLSIQCLGFSIQGAHQNWSCTGLRDLETVPLIGLQCLLQIALPKPVQIFSNNTSPGIKFRPTGAPRGLKRRTNTEKVNA